MPQQLDVLLVLPPMYQSGRIADYNPKEPMGLMYLASALRQNNYSVEILDADVMALSTQEALRSIISRPATIIGFSVLQRALPSLKILVEGLRANKVDSHICCGGFTATLSTSHILRQVSGIDSVVLGEGEITFSKLVEAIKAGTEWRSLDGIAFRQNGKTIVNAPASKPDLDRLPLPSRDVLPYCLETTNYATILASRGCYGVCTFCSNYCFERKSVGPNWRGRNPKDVVEEMEYLSKEYGVEVFKFNDPNLFGPGRLGRQHVINLCQEIIAKGLANCHLMAFCRANDIDEEVAYFMKKAGFERLLIGIESINPETLWLLQKGVRPEGVHQAIQILQKFGISIIPGFMIFNPYTTVQSIEQDLAFLERYGFTPILSKALRVYDGITLQELLKAEGRLIWKDPFEGYHEYLVDPLIAAIYMALKTISVQWLDTLKKRYQGIIWKIKRAQSFYDRRAYDIFCQMLFNLERNALRALIAWATDGNFRVRDIELTMAQIETQLMAIENYLLSFDNNFQTPKLKIWPLSRISFEIYSILSKKEFSTFPEQYRWLND